MAFKHKIKNALILTLLFLSFGFGFLPQTAFAKKVEPENYVKATLLTENSNVSAGETIRVGLATNILPGWHVYWKNPGDSGTPPEIKWTLPPGFSVSELEFQTPVKLPFGSLTNYGYTGGPVFLQNLTFPKDLVNGPFMLQATVNLLVCHDICIPESHEVSLLFNANKKPNVETTNSIRDVIKYANSLLPIDKDWTATYKEENDDFIVSVVDLKTDDTMKISLSRKFSLFPEDWGAIDNSAKADIKVLDNKFTITQKRGERDLSDIADIPIVLSYKNSSGNIEAIRLIAKAETTNAIASVASADKNTNSFGLWQALFFALFGGLILNLMPCVFPVLSMKALSLINLHGKEEKKARGYGLSYTLGILISFGIIGGSLLLLKAGGAQIGWGFQLQNPIIIIFLTYLVFIIGLNFSGLFEFSGRFSNFGGKLAQQSGNKGAFFTGVLATLVATPCTAPFMGAAMGFALTQPAYISMLVFLALGFGLALPYLALCYIPALRGILPKPGHWMETFRQFLAFPMFITTAWLVWVLSQQIGSIDVFGVLLSLIAIVFSIWLYRVLPTQGFSRIFSQILILLSLIFIITLPFLPKKEIPTMGAHPASQNWDNFTPDILTNLLESTDDPVFTNMTAAWCITCKANEKIALSTDSTKALFQEKHIQYLKGDWTNQNPEITQYLNSFDRQGVPLYVYYGPRDTQTGKRPEPVVLPQILTAGLIEKTIQSNTNP